MPLLTARSVSAERAGRTADALAVLVVLLDPGYAQTERHLLLPDLVRLAVALGDVDTARAAAETCGADAARVATPGRQAAADRCRGMLSGDPGPVLDAAGHYRRVGRRPPQVLFDIRQSQCPRRLRHDEQLGVDRKGRRRSRIQ